MVLWELVGLLLVVREGVDPHVAVITTPLRVSHGSGGEVGGRHHDWGLHALLPHLTAAALLWKGRATVLDKLTANVNMHFIPRCTQSYLISSQVTVDDFKFNYEQL